MDHIFFLSAATLAAGFLRGVTGFGFGLAAVPLFSLVVPPLHAVIVIEILQIAAAPFDIYQHHRRIDRKAVGLLCLGTLVGAPVGALLATQLPPDVMRVAIAALVFVGLFALLAKVAIPDGRGPALGTGCAAGLLAGLAAMPGPPAVAYFLGRGADKATSRASLLIYFSFAAALALLFIELGSDAISVDLLYIAAASYPALLIGTYAGSLLFKRLGDGHYRMAALGIMLISALLTGIKGLNGLL